LENAAVVVFENPAEAANDMTPGLAAQKIVGANNPPATPIAGVSSAS
jgi:hypothetical protein